MSAATKLRRALAFALTAWLSGCGSSSPASETIPVGLLLSYSGDLAANSINSERALLMAIEAANQAGGLGLGGLSIAVLARDTRSDARRVTSPASELLDAGVTLFIGPDTTELAVQLKSLLAERTIIMPSFTTSDSNLYKPNSWFVMGAPAGRVACELQAQLVAGGRQKPLVVADADGYNSLLGWELVRRYGMTRIILPTDDESSDSVTIAPIVAQTSDAYVLAALPASATSLLYALAAVGALSDASRWYLSPTLHNPALLETVPKDMMAGAQGVATGTVAGAADFRTRFAQRWQDTPLDDAYAFYDAGAVAVLALQRALVREGTIPTGTGLSQHVIAVTQASGQPITWDQIPRGVELLRQGQEVGYFGLSGLLEFDATGQTRAAASTNWWTIGSDGFADVPSQSDCR